MNRHRILVLLLVLVTLIAIAGASTAAGPDPVVTQLKAKLRASRGVVSDQQLQIAAQDAVIEDQAAMITRLRVRLANQPDPLDVILAGDPDDLWQAMVAIWRATQPLPAGELCGYDKAYSPAEGDGLALTSFTFYRWSGC